MSTPHEHARLLRWLREDDPAKLERLRRLADATRRRRLGEAVRLRALVEISSHCRRDCTYCGLRRSNRRVARHRLDAESILECARAAERWNIDTVVLQAGEDEAIEARWLAEVIARIGRETGRVVTLSLGERTDAELAQWRAAGALRYLLRFETSDRALYRRIHPPLRHQRSRDGRGRDRIEMLGSLRALGYEVGSGTLVGLPGQSDESVADDLLLFRALRLDMIGVGPFVPHPATPLGRSTLQPAAASPRPRAHRGVSSGPRSIASDRCARVVALARLLCPWAHIPSTTALATTDRAGGAVRGLRWGADVLMPDLTPPPLRQAYEIYPGKAGSAESATQCYERAVSQALELGRSVG